MYVADTKRLTLAGARKMMATAIGEAEAAGTPIAVAITDTGGHLVMHWAFDDRIARAAIEAIGATYRIDAK